MKVIITGAAFADLLHIGQEIEKDSPARAETFITELHDRCSDSGECPAPFHSCQIGKCEAPRKEID